MSVTHTVTCAARAVVKDVVFVFSIHLLFTAHTVTGNSVTCDVPSVEPLASTSVTCHFPEDVRLTRRIIAVYFYKGANYREEDDILFCWRLLVAMDCIFRPGYMFNRMISDKLTLKIPRVSTQHIGKYACWVSNITASDIKPCELKIKLEGKTMCDVPSVRLNSRTSLTCFFPEDLSETRADFGVYHYSSHSDAGDVLSCKWRGDHWSCNTVPGYEFDYTVTNLLTLGIPNAQEEQEGSYRCHFTSNSSVRFESCSLTFGKVTSFCNISSVKERKPASLTCTFDVDVNATRTNFSVVRIGGVDSTGHTYRSVDIVTCSWLKDQLNCTTAPGYEFKNTVTDHLVIRVPRASRDHSGTYACHVMGLKSTGFAPCEFIIMTGNTVMCDAPPVEPLVNTSVTCHFPEDVSQTRRNVTVSFFKGANYSEDILNCWWLLGKINCAVQSGYEFNKMISDELTLKIPRVLTQHIGGYACKLSNMDPNNIKPCELKIKKLEGKTVCDVPSVPLNSRTSLKCFFPEDLSNTRADFGVYHYSSRSDGGDVMSCNWKGDSLFCNMYIRGYEFDHTVTNHLTLGIPNAQEDHEGSYSCHFTSSAPVRYDNCSLTFVTAKKTRCEISLTSHTSLTCYFPEDLSKIRADFTVYRHSIEGSTGTRKAQTGHIQQIMSTRRSSRALSCNKVLRPVRGFLNHYNFGSDSCFSFKDAVTLCGWEKDTLNCSTVSGYKIDGNVTDHVTLMVYNTSEDHEGNYNCQITGSGSVEYENCSLQLEAGERSQTGTTSSCNISSVKDTEAAELMCTFSVDVNVTRHNFKVLRLGHGGKKDVDILVCFWVGDGLHCTTSPTYEFNNTVTSQLVVRIPRASRDHNGTYTCLVLGSKLDGFESCEFMVATGRCTSNFTL